ncbi:hypothetical protein B0T13DRAFT_228682 [Neurospora crassa]|nr:hypothetical protein B0T13DRAFT_228682 [Neurospora crassa]
MISPSIPQIEDETEHIRMIRRGREWRQHSLQAPTQRTRLTPRRRLHYCVHYMLGSLYTDDDDDEIEPCLGLSLQQCNRLHYTAAQHGQSIHTIFRFFLSSGFHLSITQNKRAACVG